MTDVLGILFVIIATTWQGWCCSHTLDKLRLWKPSYLAQNTKLEDGRDERENQVSLTLKP